MAGLLEVKNLSVSFDTPGGEIQAVRDVSFTVKPGEVLAIVGESGCGKSVLCKSILKLLPDIARIKEGSILLNGVDITGYRERDMCRLRGKLFSMVFQNPMTSLNPSLSVGVQIAEAVKLHKPGISGKDIHDRVIELMNLVGFDHPEERMRQYSWQLSGGMRQRCVMAIALAGEPGILFADEPTTALDVTVQAQILELLREIQDKLHTATVFVTHDLGVVARVADRVAVMYAGKIVETGTAEEIFHDPKHPYTWGLMRALPAFAKGDTLYQIPGMPPTLIDPPRGDAFACRNEYALAIDYEKEPPMFRVTDTHYAASWLLDERAKGLLAAPPKLRLSQGKEGAYDGRSVREKQSIYREKPVREKQPVDTEQPEILLDVQHLTHRFRLTKKKTLTAVDDVSFQIRRGEIFGLIGESGSGKSTAARCIMNVCKPFDGRVVYRGINVCDPKAFRSHKKMLQSSRQMIFQDSDSSLNPRMKVGDIIAEPMKLQHVRPPRGTLRAEAEFQMRCAGLDAAYLDKYPSELSGGQRQRAAIARALSMEPELLVADEPVASLDVSMQAQIINLFRHLQAEHGFSFLFISHDLSVVKFLCDRVGVMYRGRLVETAPVKELFAHPAHPYTQMLLASIPIPDPAGERAGEAVCFWEENDWREGEMVEIAPDHMVRQRRQDR